MSTQQQPSARELAVQGVYSKINWTQIVAAAAMLMAFVSEGKLGLDASQQAALIVVIGVFFNILTWIIRTWFSPTITAKTETTTVVTTTEPNTKTQP